MEERAALCWLPHYCGGNSSMPSNSVAWFWPRGRRILGLWDLPAGEVPRIAFLAVPGLSDDNEKPRHNGMHHCAFEYGSFQDLMASFDRMRKEGIEPAFCLDHGMTISLYYRDPEGNFVELQSDIFGD